MTEHALLLFHLSRVIFAISNILLFYAFLTPKRPLWFQGIAFVGVTAAHLCLRAVLTPMGLDPFTIGYVLALLYLVPITLVFQENLHSKVFVTFMVLSLSQFNFLISFFLERLLFDQTVSKLILTGQLLELFSIPLIRKYIAPYVKNILEIVDRQNRVFAWFPFFSFVLLAFYGVQRNYLLVAFIPLILSTIIIFFSYYLIALAIERTKRQQQLELISKTDSLTGLYNRWHMEQQIQEAYAAYQKYGAAFALIIADIDLFKTYNDRYGHAGGDYLLRAMAEELQASVRERDVVARWGGDEFLLLLPETSGEKAAKLAERIRKNVEGRKYVYEGEALSVTLTLGVSVVRCNSDTVEDIIKQADMLMYEGKRAGRDRIMFADCIHSDETLARL